ncbi:MAG: Pyrolysin precursor [Candidatus Heimdallarchaeota archaeon LC_3]|nr:MAG: Pyrolysin precursor [Candidatus Heimdallarchaeota archaeon LC_3]
MGKKIFFLLFITLIIIFTAFNLNNYLFLNFDEKNLNIDNEKKDNLDPRVEANVLSLTTTMREDLGIQSLLDLGYNGSKVTVGIIDSGVNGWHPEFESRVIDNKTFTLTLYGYSENTTSTIDIEFGGSGHGTGVASLIMGKTLGMAPGANLISAKLFHSSTAHGNNGVAGEETSLAVVEAIKWLVDEKNVSVINLSIGQYHNMYNEGREYWINKYSLEKNVIFVVSAGNEGTYNDNYGSIGNPGISLQAITVGTSEWSAFSSNGPRYDNALKPDVVAPGVGVSRLRADTGTLTSSSGTSFSAPLVAGSVASLISALKNNNISYTPGTIKSAFLSTAQPLNNDQFRQGAGLINAFAAYNLILSTTKTNSTLPDLITPFPNKLPYVPLTTHFLGQRMTYNVTLISSGLFHGIVSVNDIPSNFISFPEQIDILDSTLFPVTINIPEDAIPGFYNGSIIITTDRNDYSIEIFLEFHVRQPKIEVLLDFTHSGIINEYIGGINSPVDPWTSSFLWGPYQRFFLLLTSFDVSVTTALPNELANITQLSKFDLVLIVNPATKVTGTFTDWWNDLTFFPESDLDNNINEFTSSEINTLMNYVSNFGGNLQIFTSYPAVTNVTEVNKLLNTFNISYQDTQEAFDFQLNEISNDFEINNFSIDYIGGSLIDFNQYEGSFYESLGAGNAFAYWESSSNGSVFVSGSSFMLELGLSPLGTFPDNNLDFYLGLLNQLNIVDPDLTTSTNPSTGTSEPSQTDVSSQFSVTNNSINSSSLSIHVNSTVGGFLIIFVIIGLLTLRKRNFR